MIVLLPECKSFMAVVPNKHWVKDLLSLGFLGDGALGGFSAIARSCMAGILSSRGFVSVESAQLSFSPLSAFVRWLYMSGRLVCRGLLSFSSSMTLFRTSLILAFFPFKPGISTGL